MNGFTFAFLCFLLIFSTSALRDSQPAGSESILWLTLFCSGSWPAQATSRGTLTGHSASPLAIPQPLQHNNNLYSLTLKASPSTHHQGKGVTLTSHQPLRP
jgi:hypothetical protein